MHTVALIVSVFGALGLFVRAVLAVRADAWHAPADALTALSVSIIACALWASTYAPQWSWGSQLTSLVQLLYLAAVIPGIAATRCLLYHTTTE